MAKPDHRAVVAKAHTLVDKMAKYRLQELRLLAFCLAHYNSKKGDNHEIQTSVEEMRAIFPAMDEKSAYMVIRETFKSLGNKPLEFVEEGELVYWNWFEGFKYKIGAGTFKFYMNRHLAPYLFELEGKFTEYRLRDVYQFKSANTWKLYEHLKKSWKYEPIWVVSLDELKIKLGIPLKYPRWSDFKERVIDPSIAEINQKSDISVAYTLKKDVRTVAGLIFTIDTKRSDESIPTESPREKLLKTLLSYGVNGKTAQDYTEKIDVTGRSSEFVKIITDIKKRWDKGSKGDNLQKYLIGAVKSELRQQNLPFKRPVKALHAEAQTCWNACKGTCGVFQYGTPPQPACEYCPGRPKKTTTLDSSSQKS